MTEELRFARGKRASPFGPATHEIKTKVPEPIYNQFVMIAGAQGKDRAEVLREMVLEETVGAVTAITNRDMRRPDSAAEKEIRTALPQQARDHLGALATLNGTTAEQYLQELILTHLYGRKT